MFILLQFHFCAFTPLHFVLTPNSLRLRLRFASNSRFRFICFASLRRFTSNSSTLSPLRYATTTVSAHFAFASFVFSASLRTLITLCSTPLRSAFIFASLFCIWRFRPKSYAFLGILRS